MMKSCLCLLVVLLLWPVVVAQDKPAIPANACLAVYPGGDPCVANWGVHAGRLTPGCFSYLESANLPLKEVRTYYLKKDLEKLEKRGVKVVVSSTAQAKGSACPD
jgi:hypothetical protein